MGVSCTLTGAARSPAPADLVTGRSAAGDADDLAQRDLDTLRGRRSCRADQIGLDRTGGDGQSGLDVGRHRHEVGGARGRGLAGRLAKGARRGSTDDPVPTIDPAAEQVPDTTTADKEYAR